MLPTFSRERMRDLASKTFQVGCLVTAFLISPLSHAEWKDPLNVPSVKTERAHESLLLDVTRADKRLVAVGSHGHIRSEEHTSELQSRPHLVCRLLLEKKKQNR